MAKAHQNISRGFPGPSSPTKSFFETAGRRINADISLNIDKSPEYWAGWILAYYQWHTGMGFARLHELGITTDHLLNQYSTLHEADVDKFVELADELIKKNSDRRATNLKVVRKAAGLTQKALAERSGTSLRMVQLYKQRNKDINKAQAITLAKLARTLGCDIGDLLEPEITDR